MKSLFVVLSFIMFLASFTSKAQMTIVISRDGQIIGVTQDGTDSKPDYYTSSGDGVKWGKVKKIGTITIDYYTSSSDGVKLGLVKKIGTIPVDYYTSSGDGMKLRKVKKIGAAQINYFTSSGDGAKAGQIKDISGNPGDANIQIAVGL